MLLNINIEDYDFIIYFMSQYFIKLVINIPFKKLVMLLFLIKPN